jgi:molybdopterin-guanine dinucleotide biosynthesis protein A
LGGGTGVTGVAILAGGNARRLGGVTKPLMVIDGRRIIDRQLDVLRPLFGAAIVIVANDPVPFRELGVSVIPDRVGPGVGPLAGLDAALAFFPPDVTAVVCVAGDMPFLHPDVLRALRDAGPAPAVVPRLLRGAEPLCARYDRTVAPRLATALATGMRALHVFVDTLGATYLSEDDARRLDPTLRTFTNLNAPDDLRAV